MRRHPVLIKSAGRWIQCLASEGARRGIPKAFEKAAGEVRVIAEAAADGGEGLLLDELLRRRRTATGAPPPTRMIPEATERERPRRR